MTTYTHKVYKGLPFSYRLKKSRYYDIVGKAKISADTELTKSFENYSGLTTNFNQNVPQIPYVQITNGVLPNYTPTAGGKYSFAPNGNAYLMFEQGYYNFLVYGTPNINMLTGVVSGFSVSDYIRRSLQSIGSTFEVYIKFKTPATTVTGGQVILDIGTRETEFNPVQIFIDDLGTGLYVKASNTSNSHVIDTSATPYAITTDTTYYMKAVSDGSATYFYISTTGFETMTLLASELAMTKINVSAITLGKPYGGTYKGPFAGEIDLSATCIKINGNIYWNPYDYKMVQYNGILASGVTDDGTAKNYNLFYNGNFVVDTAENKTGYEWCGVVAATAHTVYQPYILCDSWSMAGLPEIKPGFVMSGFSTSDYVSTNYIFAPQVTDSFKIQIKFTTGATANNHQTLLDCGANQYGPLIKINSSHQIAVEWLFSGDETANSAHTDFEVTEDTTYWVRIVKPLTEFFSLPIVMEYSLDGQTWVQFGSFEVPSSLVASAAIKVGAARTNNQYFRGVIDMTKTFVEINNVKTWQMIKTV